MRLGIVVPFSWSFWGGIVEHAELQASALEARGHDVRLVMANDPPGQLTRALHPRVGRHGHPPPNVIPVGRSVIVPANGSLPNICLSPRSHFRIRRVLRRERFDLLHLHEPMTPAICVSTLATATCPIVATHHASGDLGWMKAGMPWWGFLLSRIDYRIAVSERAKESIERWVPGPTEVVPNGVPIPDASGPEERDHAILFAGRHEQRKGLHVLLRAWPAIRERTGLTLRVAGADPLAVRLLQARLRVPDDGLEVLGFLRQEDLTETLRSVKALVAPSLGGESFGMVIARAFACGTPVVASDIPGYREVTTAETSITPVPDDARALVEAVTEMVGDEARRRAMGRAARELAVACYGWPDIAARLEAIYAGLLEREPEAAAA